ncbi:MAG: hypothetical protein IKT57_07140 [Clostridia bacterium]|nr:hypothetical protein [Clostridia bacterium]
MSQQCQNNPYQTVRRFCTCIDGAIALFAGLLALAIGIILGAVFAETLLPALAAIIVFAIAMLAAIIALLIYRRCAFRR